MSLRIRHDRSVLVKILLNFLFSFSDMPNFSRPEAAGLVHLYFYSSFTGYSTVPSSRTRVGRPP